MAMGDEAMTDARNSVEKKNNGDGDRGVICSRTRVSGGVGWKGRRKKSGGEGGGACVGFVVPIAVPRCSGKYFFASFSMDWEGGWDADAVQSEAEHHKTTNSRL